MKSVTILNGVTKDVRFELKDDAGSDAVHTNPVYAYAVCCLKTDSKLEGIGLAFTLGTGNELVCRAIEYLLPYVEGREINELMTYFGSVSYKMANDPKLRWLGPHKGIVHLALASITNACFDLWAKSHDLPLWKLLVDLPPESLVNVLDLSYLEEILTAEDAVAMLKTSAETKDERREILKTGYRGYDTSIGWFGYSDEKIKQNVKIAMDQGFTAMKLKVGSTDYHRDLQRAEMVRQTAGDKATIMFDANQQWNLPQAIEICRKLQPLNPFWIEEPTHPDDLNAHATLVREIAPVKVAAGEHLPNRVIFKNYLQSQAFHFNQVDAVRVGGVAEFITISLISRKFGIPVVPHVGDMGQIHQHLILFNHMSLEHEALFLEHIPHLQEYFKDPARIEGGYYAVPEKPGASCDLKN